MLIEKVGGGLVSWLGLKWIFLGLCLWSKILRGMDCRRGLS